MQVEAHWHEGIRASAARVLGLFEAADGATFAALRRAVEAEEGGGAGAGEGEGERRAAPPSAAGAQGDAGACSAGLAQLSLGGAPPRSPPTPPGPPRAAGGGAFLLPVSDLGIGGGGGGGGGGGARRAAKPITLLANVGGDE